MSTIIIIIKSILGLVISVGGFYFVFYIFPTLIKMAIEPFENRKEDKYYAEKYPFLKELHEYIDTTNLSTELTKRELRALHWLINKDMDEIFERYPKYTSLILQYTHREIKDKIEEAKNNDPNLYWELYHNYRVVDYLKEISGIIATLYRHKEATTLKNFTRYLDRFDKHIKWYAKSPWEHMKKSIDYQARRSGGNYHDTSSGTF